MLCSIKQYTTQDECPVPGESHLLKISIAFVNCVIKIIYGEQRIILLKLLSLLDYNERHRYVISNVIYMR